MNPKRTLYLFTQPLTRTNLVTVLRDVAPKASILFVSSSSELEVTLIFSGCRIIGNNIETDEHRNNEMAILKKIKKIQPLDENTVCRMPIPAEGAWQLPSIWGLY